MESRHYAQQEENEDEVVFASIASHCMAWQQDKVKVFDIDII